MKTKSDYYTEMLINSSEMFELVIQAIDECPYDDEFIIDTAHNLEKVCIDTIDKFYENVSVSVGNVNSFKNVVMGHDNAIIIFNQLTILVGCIKYYLCKKDNENLKYILDLIANHSNDFELLDNVSRKLCAILNNMKHLEQDYSIKIHSHVEYIKNVHYLIYECD